AGAPVRAGLVLVVGCCFFSSRRRHTRFSRDWSSDVCSSDLVSGSRRRAARHVRALAETKRRSRHCNMTAPKHLSAAVASPQPSRSEERRVGKECRSRGGAEQSKAKDGEADTWVEQTRSGIRC